MATITLNQPQKVWRWRQSALATWLIILLMTGILAAFYQLAGQYTIIESGLWLAGFGLLALLRPDLALLFVIAAAPLTYRARGFWDATFGVNDTYFPVHELALCITAGATLLYLRPLLKELRPPRALLLPGLWLAAGTLAALIATPEGQRAAWREWRWMIVEPLVLYLLVRWWGRDPAVRMRLIGAVLVAGVGVAVIGLLQHLGAEYDFSPIVGVSSCFSDSVISQGLVQRVSSVYCHPNNMALWLDRTWLLALVLLVGTIVRALTASLDLRRWRQILKPGVLITLIFYAGCLVISAYGMRATYSKGAWLAGALVLLALVLLSRRRIVIVAGSIVVALMLSSMIDGNERMDIMGGSSYVRLSVWQSGLAMWRDHPVLGIGLDQFFYYFNPLYGRSYIGARASAEPNTAHPHNLILDLLLRVGLFGTGVFGIIIVRTARRGWEVWRSADPQRWMALGILAGGATGLLHGLVDQGYFSPDIAILTWLLIGLIDQLWSAGRKESLITDPG